MEESEIKSTVNRATGNWLRQLRAQKGLSQTQLQDHMDVSRSYISNVEQGKKPLPLWRLIQLCKQLEMEPTTAIQRISNEVYSKNKG